jgi:hypothetical protein
MEGVGRLPLFVCIRFQSLFHSLVRVLFSFPSRYFSTIGQNRFSRLRGWSPFLPTRSFLVVLTFFIHSSAKGWRGYRAFTFSGVVSFILLHPQMTPALVPSGTRAGGNVNFRKFSFYKSLLLKNDWPSPSSLSITNGVSVDFFLLATKMFQFASFFSFGFPVGEAWISGLTLLLMLFR